jgi:hypothetical protein
MVELAGVATDRQPMPWWLQALYAVLLSSALALVTLIVGEVYYAFEGAEATFAHDHGLFGPLFDLAWIVFLPTTFATLVGALVALPLGPITHSAALTRYASRATTYLALAIGILAVVAVLQS